MSIESAMTRMTEIQSMISGQQTVIRGGSISGTATAPGAGGATDGSFANALSQAQGVNPAAKAGGSPTRFDPMINEAARRHGVDPALLKALIKQESGFNPKAGSPAGAQGLTQLMPATARGLGVSDPFDPKQAIEGGAKYLAQQLKAFGNDPQKALAAYNAGPGAVQKYGGIPPYAETQNYVKNVMKFAREFGFGASGGGAAASAASVQAAQFAAPPTTSLGKIT